LILDIIQGIFAALFAMAGTMKSMQPINKLLKSGITWAGRFPTATVRLLGVSELLGAIVLILPLLFTIIPVHKPLAATGRAFVQLLAIFHHAKYKEGKAIVFNNVLLP
jgi:hypothetical protein